MQVAALVLSGSEHPALTPGDLALLPGQARWLWPGRAAEVILACDDPLALEAALRSAAADAPFDVAVVPVAGRRKRLLVADMDSTIITVECLDELADEAGIKPAIAAITERAMRGELEFESALRARVAQLTGLDEAALARTFKERVCLSPGAKALTATMRANGAYTALISGGFTYFTQRVAALAGFDHHRGNQLIVADGRLTGTVGEPILGQTAKADALSELAKAHGLTPDQTLAIGDGANDLDMLRRAGFGIAYHAKPKVAAAARYRIDHADLTAALFLQGYDQSTIVPGQ